MFRKLIIAFMSLSLCWTTVGCGSPSNTASTSTPTQTQTQTPTQTVAPAKNQPTSGEYPVQQAQYNDADGEYTFMLLNTPAGSSPVYRTTDVQMARLSDEDIEAEKQTYLTVDGDQGILYLTADFKIEYVHNETETVTDPQTGQQQTIVVRQRSSFWTPFAASFIGSAIANTLFAPRYYVPPVYQPGGTLMGYGGYGNTYDSAVSQYRSRYNEPPAAVKNSQVLRTSGAVRNSANTRTTPTSSSTKSKSSTSSTTSPSRSTGSGFGSSNLKQNSKGSSQTTKKRTPSFGSSGSSRRYRRTPSFGGSRRRR